MYLTPTDRKRRWYDANRDMVIERERHRRTDINHQAESAFKRAKKRAGKKGLEFTVEFSDLLIPTHCPVFPWIELTAISGEGFVDSNISLDRISSELGYVKGNVQFISYKANRNKNNSTLEELLALGEWAKDVLNANN